MAVLIKKVIPGSPADKAGIKAGERLISVNGSPIDDVLDYMFHADEGMGLEFDTFLMDKKRHCGNKCIFCFIDQMPPGLRDSLYFKDDDSRLSFLQGNYITLTNLTEHDVERIIAMRTPVNVSVHTTNPELRVKMMGNPRAGQWSLDVLKRFADAGVSMNCQLVLCPEHNDGDELVRSLRDLSAMDSVESIACVPVGLTRFREGLTPLREFTASESAAVIKIVEEVGEHDKFTSGEQTGQVFAADEFYLKAGIDFPEYEHYGDFPQYENGVGMWVYTREHFDIADIVGRDALGTPHTIVTGTAAFPLIRELVADVPNVNAAAIRNDFFGESVTVSGLLTGGDIIAQLRDFPDLGEVVVIGSNMLNSDGLFLDEAKPEQIEEALGVKVLVAEVDS
jgi:putative radical SAM enzyme (TIGR03279 family)